MSSSHVRKALENYFKSMNSISEKIVLDIQKSCEDEEWGLFPNEEQAVIQWKKFIDPCLEEKYRPDANGEKIASSFPVLLVQSGEKLVIDEDTSNGRPFGSSWNDEHSSPFSWETKSQLKLHLSLEENKDNVSGGQACTPKTPPSARSFKKIPTPKVTPRPSPKPSPALTRKSIKIPSEQPPVPPRAVTPQTEKPVERRTRPKNPAPPPPIMANQCPKKDPDIRPQEKPSEVVLPVISQLPLPVTKEEEVVEEDATSETSSQIDVETPSNAIPKTGFDFLDNW